MMGKAKEASERTRKAKSVNKTTKESSSTLDPALQALFDSSTPREPLSSTRASYGSPSRSVYYSKSLHQASEDELTSLVEEHSSSSEVSAIVPTVSKKRKRLNREEEIEDRYLKKLALEEEKDLSARRKPNRSAVQQDDEDDASTEVDGQQADKYLDHENTSTSSQTEDGDEDGGVDVEKYKIPQHESLAAAGPATEMDKATRTVFLGNVSTEAIRSKASKRVLLEYLTSFTSEMKDSSDHKVESIRFRSTAFADSSIPKKAAFAKQQLMDATTKSTNAYVVYSTATAAREATRRLNGTVILHRHLRVDSVAHPAAVDHRKCVFVGNLGFVDDESNIKANETEDRHKRPKAKEAADVEEGLWVHFAKAGPVESVRVVRDRTTRVGKGIAYVQFKDPNSVEKALLMNEKKFPPMLPRKLRVSRARKLRKTGVTKGSNKLLGVDRKAMHHSQQPAKLSSLVGRADRMLGRAGAHHMRKGMKQRSDPLKSRKDIVFEGHRAVPNRSPMLSKDGKKKRPDRRTSRSTAHRSRAGRA